MSLDQHSSLTALLAGISFFMFGMSLTSNSLQKLMANRMRELLGHINKSKFITFLVGIALTTALQSSGAVTSMLVGLGSAGVMRLQQVMGLILGAAVGSTITVQLISFNISQFGLATFAIAFSLYFLMKKRVVKNFLSVFMGFGLLFFGIELLSLSAQEIQKIDYLASAFTYLNQYPLVAFLVSVLFTGFVHSSAVTIGFVITLVAGGLIGYIDAIYWVLGANVGTASTALLAAVGGGYVGRQIAWAHLFYRLASVLIFLPFVAGLAHIVSLLPGVESVSRDIANVHTVFNLLSALIFLPFIKFGADLVEKVVPPRDHEQDFTTEFIDSNDYQSTTLAIAFAKRELFRMGDIVQSMIRDSIHLFDQDDPELVSDITERDNQIDHLHHEIKLFLVNQASDSTGVSKEIFDLISYANDLESVADVIDNNLVELARKKQALKLEFSDVGWAEIQKLHGITVKMGAMAMSAFQTNSVDMAEEVIRLKREGRKVERKLRESHIERLNQGLSESINTSAIHLDILGDYRRVSGLLANYSYVMRKRSAKK